MICVQCCAEKRLVEIQCDDGCAFLIKGRERAFLRFMETDGDEFKTWRMSADPDAPGINSLRHHLLDALSAVFRRDPYYTDMLVVEAVEEVMKSWSSGAKLDIELNRKGVLMTTLFDAIRSYGRRTRPLAKAEVRACLSIIRDGIVYRSEGRPQTRAFIEALTMDSEEASEREDGGLIML